MPDVLPKIAHLSDQEVRYLMAFFMQKQNVVSENEPRLVPLSINTKRQGIALSLRVYTRLYPLYRTIPKSTASIFPSATICTV